MSSLYKSPEFGTIFFESNELRPRSLEHRRHCFEARGNLSAIHFFFPKVDLHHLLQMLSRYVMMEICWLIIRHRRRRCAISLRSMDETKRHRKRPLAPNLMGFGCVTPSIRPLLRRKRVGRGLQGASQCSSSDRQQRRGINGNTCVIEWTMDEYGIQLKCED